MTDILQKIARAEDEARRCEDVAFFGRGGIYRRDVHREEALEWRALAANLRAGLAR